MPGIFRRGWRPRPRRRFAPPLPPVVFRDFPARAEWAGTILDPTVSAVLPIEWSGIPASGSGKSSTVHFEFGATAEPPPCPIEWGIRLLFRGGGPLSWIAHANMIRDASLPLEVPGYAVSTNPLLPVAIGQGIGGVLLHGASGEWLAQLAVDLPLPIVAPASIGHAVERDIGTPLEWRFSVPGAPVRFGWLTTRGGDPLLTVGETAGQVSPTHAAPLEWRGGLIMTDRVLPLESGHALPGAPVGVEFDLSARAGASRLPLAGVAQLRTDRNLPIDALTHPPFLFADAAAPLEWGSTPDSPRLQFEWRAMLATDRGLILETTGRAGLRADAPLVLEFGQNLFVGADALLPLATAALLTTDCPLPLQILGSSRAIFDQTVSAEWLGRSVIDRGLIAEIARNFNSVLTDRGLPIETAALFSADRSAPLAWLDAVAPMRPLPIAMLGDIGRDAALPAEVIGGAVAALRVMPAEALHAAAVDGMRLGWARKAARDGNLPAEWHSLLTVADAFLPTEILSPFVAAMFELPLAARSSRLRDMGLPAEAISPAIMARAELPLAIGGNLLAPHPLMAEWLADRTIARTLPTEALRAALGDARVPVAFGRMALRDHPIAVAMLGSELRRFGVNVETSGNLVLLRAMPTEILRAALRDAGARAEVLGAGSRGVPVALANLAARVRAAMLQAETSGILGALVPGPALAFDARFAALVGELPIDFLGTLPPHPAAADRLVLIGWDALLPPPLIAIDGDRLLASPALVRILEWRRSQ